MIALSTTTVIFITPDRYDEPMEPVSSTSPPQPPPFDFAAQETRAQARAEAIYQRAMEGR